jgi:ArsR family transcriptional regulator
MSKNLSIEVSPSRVENISKIFNALGNPVRLRILLMVQNTRRPLHIKAISRELKVDYAAVYRHVEILREAGLLEIFEVGRSRVLSLADPTLLSEFLGRVEKAGSTLSLKS